MSWFAQLPQNSRRVGSFRAVPSSQGSGFKHMAFPICDVTGSDGTVNWESQRCAQSFELRVEEIQ